MFNLQFPIDPKLAAAIQRRRVREDERRKIILDEKKRRIGVRCLYFDISTTVSAHSSTVHSILIF